MTAQHVKINRPRPFIVAFDVTAAQSAFPFEGPFWEHDDLLVFVITDGGDAPTTWCELLERGTLLDVSAYTVTGLFIQGGGPVVGGYGSGIVNLNAAVASCMVVVDRFIVEDRDTDFNQTAPLSQNAINSDLDRLTARDQDLLWRIHCNGGEGDGGGDGGDGGDARYAATFECIGADPGDADTGVIGVHPILVATTFAANFPSFAHHADTPATGTITFDVEDQDGAVVGEVTWDTSGATATTAGGLGVEIPAGGALVCRRTSAADATLADFGWAFLGGVA